MNITKSKLLFIILLIILSVSFFLGVSLMHFKLAKAIDITEKGYVELYQLAPDNDTLMQSYVIKTTNGKFIVIDGGGNTDDNKPAYLPAALRAISGVGQNDYFEVEAWFISHAHSDHYYELAKMLNAYNKGSNFKINNFYFDFPPFNTDEFPFSDGETEKCLTNLKSGLENYAKVNNISIPANSTYYDYVNGAVINQITVAAGLTITVDDVSFDVLATWDKSRGGDANNQCIILKMHAAGQTVLFLQDCGELEGNALLNDCADKLESDIVQTAHHGQNGASQRVYNLISAEVNLWPTPLWVWKDTVRFKIGETRKWLNGTDFTTADRRNIVACLYEKYPSNPTSIIDWNKVKDSMKIALPYDWRVDGEENTLRGPYISLDSGVYVGEQHITLSTMEKNAEIYYTLDGSFPTTSSLKYTAPITLGDNENYGFFSIRAVVVRENAHSAVSTHEYYITDGAYNIALNKPIKVMNYDMTVDWSDELYSVNKTNPDGTVSEPGANDVSIINDGSFDYWYVISTYYKYNGYSGGNGVGWAIIDFGAPYVIDYIRYDAYWDWEVSGNIIQLANSPDFSDAVTVYDNPDCIMTGKENGSHRDGLMIKVNEIDRYRYLRVTNTSLRYDEPMSVFTEIQAYNKFEKSGDDLLQDKASWMVTGGGTWTNENNVVKQTDPVNTSNWTPSYTYTAKKYKNFILDASIKMDITDKSQWGYVGFGLYKPFATDIVDDFNHGFYVAVEPKGRALIWNGKEEIAPNNLTINDFSLLDGFTIRIVSIEERIFVYINGKNIFYMNDRIFNRSAGYISIQSGLIPITVSSLEIYEVTDADFANLVYQETIVPFRQVEKTYSVESELNIQDVVSYLPKYNMCADTAGNTYTLDIQWCCDDYNGERSGWYNFIGEYTGLPVGLINAYKITLQALVYVHPKLSEEVLTAFSLLDSFDETTYTEDSWSAVIYAKTTLNEIFGKEYDVDEEELNQASQSFLTALNALKLKNPDNPKNPEEINIPEGTSCSGCSSAVLISSKVPLGLLLLSVFVVVVIWFRRHMKTR